MTSAKAACQPPRAIFSKPPALHTETWAALYCAEGFNQQTPAGSTYQSHWVDPNWGSSYVARVSSHPVYPSSWNSSQNPVHGVCSQMAISNRKEGGNIDPHQLWALFDCCWHQMRIYVMILLFTYVFVLFLFVCLFIICMDVLPACTP